MNSCCRNYWRGETIQGRKLFAEIWYLETSKQSGRFCNSILIEKCYESWRFEQAHIKSLLLGMICFKSSKVEGIWTFLDFHVQNLKIPCFGTAESQGDQFISISLLTGLFPLTCERVGTCICRESILFLWNSGFWEFEI